MCTKVVQYAINNDNIIIQDHTDRKQMVLSIVRMDIPYPYPRSGKNITFTYDLLSH